MPTGPGMMHEHAPAPRSAVHLKRNSWKGILSKIVFVNRFYAPDHSATSQLLTDLAVYLARQGFEVAIVTSRQLYENPAADLPATQTIDGVSVHRVRTTRFGRNAMAGRAIDILFFYLFAAVELLGLLRRGDVVVAKTDPPMVSVIVAACAWLRGASHANWMQDLFPEVAVAAGVPFTRGLLGRVLAWIRDWSLDSAVANVAIGDRMAQAVRARLSHPGSVHVIPNWSDGRAIVPLARAANPLAREWALDDKFVVGYSGNMGRTHELVSLLDAAERLRDDPSIRFLFIGGGKQRDSIEQEARERGLDNVVFKPYQPRERLGLSLTLPDVHVASLLPAYEGMIVPSKFCGIAAAGRATLFIGAPDGEIGAILRTERCGVTFSAGDADGIAAQVRAWAADGEAVAEMGRRARDVFDRRFDMAATTLAWSRLLDQIGLARALPAART